MQNQRQSQKNTNAGEAYPKKPQGWACHDFPWRRFFQTREL